VKGRRARGDERSAIAPGAAIVRTAIRRSRIHRGPRAPRVAQRCACRTHLEPRSQMLLLTAVEVLRVPSVGGLVRVRGLVRWMGANPHKEALSVSVREPK
jgi:hypothetical protein